jgi:guanylate cyclase soluble subunit beta
MYGWINECIKSLVLEKFGQETWDAVLSKHATDTPNNEYLRYEYYSDESTMNLVGIISELLGLQASAVLETFGEYFIQYVSRQGYNNLLQCLGNTLMEWLSNVDMLHVNLSSTLPKMCAPHFR